MSSRRSGWLRLVCWLSLGTGAFAGMLLAALQLHSRWPWSSPAWNFGFVLWELASMPVAGFGGVGLIPGLALVAWAIFGLRRSRRWGLVLATGSAPLIASMTGCLWMHLGSLVAGLGV